MIEINAFTCIKLSQDLLATIEGDSSSKKTIEGDGRKKKTNGQLKALFTSTLLLKTYHDNYPEISN